MKKEYFMKTEHIGFSYWTDADLELAIQLWGEKDVTRYICATGEFTKQDILDRLNVEINNGKKYQVQYWPIFDLMTGELIGCCGLRPFKTEPHSYEIGFHLRRTYWGRGYAFEAATAVIQYAFTELNTVKIYAGHHPQNIGSRKLLTRLGFQYIGDNFYEPTGLYHPSYEMTKSGVIVDNNMKAMCGTYCGSCEWKEPCHCPGCKACDGKLFWGTCDKAKCCIRKGYENCGQCPEMPCQMLKDLFSDKEHGDNGARLNNLKNWVKGKDVYEKLR